MAVSADAETMGVSTKEPRRMSATAPTPTPPARQGSAWSAWRVAVVVLGSIVALTGASMLAGGGALMAIHLTQRDDDGFLTSPREQVSSDGYAVTAEGVELADLEDGGDWLVEQGIGRVRIRATSRTDDVFVGIAPERQVDRYLAGTAHNELRELRSGDDRYLSRDGGAPRTPPADAGIWTASATGPGTQTVEWEARDGRWAVVVMNADAARAVAADVSVGAKLGILPWIAGGLLLLGIVTAALGAGLIGIAVRGHGGTVPAVTVDAAVEAAPGAYPVSVDGQLDPGLSRWLWLVKWLLAIPHYLILALLWIAFPVLTVVALVAVVATGRYPRAIFDFNVGVLRWTWRVAFYSYGALGTDRYPPFTLGPADYPATLEIPYPAELSRGKALVKWWLLALPHYLVLAVLAGGFTTGWFGDFQAPSLNAVLVFIAAIALLFTGRYPRDIFRLVIGVNRWAFRVIAYAALMRDEYPPFRLDP
jgi:hypothetical protein